MNIINVVVPFLLCGITNVYSMENRLMQSWQPTELREEERPLSLMQQPSQSLQRLIPSSSADIIKHGKTAVRYLTYTTLPSLVMAMDPSANFEAFFSDPVTIAVVSVLGCAVCCACCIACCTQNGKQERIVSPMVSSNTMHVHIGQTHITTGGTKVYYLGGNNQKQKQRQEDGGINPLTLALLTDSSLHHPHHNTQPLAILTPVHHGTNTDQITSHSSHHGGHHGVFQSQSPDHGIAHGGHGYHGGQDQHNYSPVVQEDSPDHHSNDYDADSDHHQDDNDDNNSDS